MGAVENKKVPAEKPFWLKAVNVGIPTLKGSDHPWRLGPRGLNLDPHIPAAHSGFLTTVFSDELGSSVVSKNPPGQPVPRINGHGEEKDQEPKKEAQKCFKKLKNPHKYILYEINDCFPVKFCGITPTHAGIFFTSAAMGPNSSLRFLSVELRHLQPQIARTAQEFSSVRQHPSRLS